MCNIRWLWMVSCLRALLLSMVLDRVIPYLHIFLCYVWRSIRILSNKNFLRNLGNRWRFLEEDLKSHTFFSLMTLFFLDMLLVNKLNPWGIVLILFVTSRDNKLFSLNPEFIVLVTLVVTMPIRLQIYVGLLALRILALILVFLSFMDASRMIPI